MTAVVSDTSPVSYLCRIGEIGVLGDLFSRVLIPPAVLAELRHPHAPAEVSEWLENLPHWASIQAPVAVETGMGLDAGESEAISLALEMSLPAILIDERDGWIEAQRRGLTPIGTLNVLYTAHGLGLLDFENAIGRLRRTNFHVNSALVESLIEKVRTRKRE